MLLRQIFEPALAQYAYLIGCQKTGEALLVDPQRDVDRYLGIAEEEGLRIVAAAETHIHADFVSGARELAERAGARLYLSGEGGPEWQVEWVQSSDYEVVILRDGHRFRIGNVELEARHTPGHTPEHLSFFVTDFGGDADRAMGVMTGDFVFVGDLGRPDLLESAAGEAGAMEPAARALYRSAERFFELPDHLQVWPGHGAGSACGKSLGAVPTSTVGYEKLFNPALRAAAGDEDAFVEEILAGQPEPPPYFGRMKRVNREGPPILGSLPSPPRLPLEELVRQADDGAVLDTRPDRGSFMAGHLPGSLFTPLDRTFPTVAGSYVEPGPPIYLLVMPDNLDEAVRGLVRIGLDHIAGWTAIGEVTDAHDLPAIEVIDFETAEELRQSGALPFDVRRRTEFEEGSMPGAVNVPHTQLAGRLEEIPADRTLLVYCRAGNRSAVASAFLASRGFDIRYIDDEFEKFHQRAA